MKRFNSRRLAYTAVMLALAIIIGSIEHALPPLIPALPFVRIGFGNVVIVYCLLVLGFPEAIVISILKSVLVPLFLGNPVMIIYSLVASVGSTLISALLLRIRLSGLPIIGILGAITHNMLQLSVAAIMTSSTAVFGYAPILIIVGSASGLATGVIIYILIKYLPKKLIDIER